MRHVAQRKLHFRSEVISSSAATSENTAMLYAHIPFCESLCPYCSFHRTVYDESLSRRYFEALRAELSAYAHQGYNFRELYVGGGTPTINMNELDLTIRHARHHFDIETISIETNPNHLTTEIIDRLYALKVNRLSVGVQSFNDSLLDNMGRLHRYGRGEEILSRLEAVKGKLPTLNVDMIFNLPGQTMEMLEQDIQALLKLDIDQVSFYPLMMSDLAEERISNEMGNFSYDNEAAMYAHLVERLEPSHPRSSVWCFSNRALQSKNGKACALIDEYLVTHPNFIGAGSGAFSFVDDQFRATTFSIEQYIELIKAEQPATTRIRQLSRLDQLFYHLLTQLFSTSWQPDQTRQQFNDVVLAKFFPAILQGIGLIRSKGANKTLTDQGSYILLMAMSTFLSGVNNFRAEMKQQPDLSGLDNLIVRSRQ